MPAGRPLAVSLQAVLPSRPEEEEQVETSMHLDRLYRSEALVSSALGWRRGNARTLPVKGVTLSFRHARTVDIVAICSIAYRVPKCSHDRGRQLLTRPS